MRDNVRRGDYRSFGASETNSLKVPNDAIVGRIDLDVTINLSTPGGMAAATGARSEAPWNIIRQMYFDLDGDQRFTVSGAIQHALEQYKLKVDDLPSDSVAAPAPGNSGTIRFLLPINFGLPLSNAPELGFLDLSKYKNVYLHMTMGAIGNLFGTANDTTLDSIEVRLVIADERFGASLPVQGVFIEPIVLTENITADSTDQKIELPIGDRDYLMLLLRQETAVDTPANTVIDGAIEVKGSEPHAGSFTLRKYDDITQLQNMNQGDLRNNPLPTGYAMIDFMRRGNIERGKIGTKLITDWAVHAGVAGAANNKINVAALVIIRG